MASRYLSRSSRRPPDASSPGPGQRMAGQRACPTGMPLQSLSAFTAFLLTAVTPRKCGPPGARKISSWTDPTRSPSASSTIGGHSLIARMLDRAKVRDHNAPTSRPRSAPSCNPSRGALQSIQIPPATKTAPGINAHGSSADARAMRIPAPTHTRPRTKNPMRVTFAASTLTAVACLERPSQGPAPRQRSQRRSSALSRGALAASTPYGFPVPPQRPRRCRTATITPAPMMTITATSRTGTGSDAPSYIRRPLHPMTPEAFAVNRPARIIITTMTTTLPARDLGAEPSPGALRTIRAPPPQPKRSTLGR